MSETQSERATRPRKAPAGAAARKKAPATSDVTLAAAEPVVTVAEQASAADQQNSDCKKLNFRKDSIRLVDVIASVLFFFPRNHDEINQ